MENEVWSEISAFLNNLRCGDVSRKSYLHFPELEEAEKIRKVKKNGHTVKDMWTVFSC